MPTTASPAAPPWQLIRSLRSELVEPGETWVYRSDTGLFDVPHHRELVSIDGQMVVILSWADYKSVTYPHSKRGQVIQGLVPVAITPYAAGQHNADRLGKPTTSALGEAA